LTLPDKATRYYPIKAALSTGETHLLTVVEVKGKRSTWHVLLDGKTVSPEITLPGSHNRFAPQILAENWNAGTRKCNDYSYSFRDIRIALAPGGSWRLPKPGYLWRDRHNQAVRLSRDAFVARSTDLHTAAGDDVPPALGPLASSLTGRRLTAECIRQVPFVRERPANHLLLAKRVCEILLGYTVAQPWAPLAESRPGHVVAATALGYLRGDARVARAGGRDRLPCRRLVIPSDACAGCNAGPRARAAQRAAPASRPAPGEAPLRPGCRFR
jgi:hypothetical protein